MILSEKTLAILKNFASINQSILVRSGNTLKTISPEKNILAKVSVTESFANDFAIYDLGSFLGVISLFKNPEMIFEDDHMKITDGKNSVRYVYADPSIIVSAPDKDIKLPSTDVSFVVTEEQMASVLKAGNVIGVPDITFKGDGKVITMIAHDKKNPKSNEYVIEIGTTEDTFSVDYRSANFKFIQDEYTVSISQKMISSFEGKNGGVTYFVACETTSKFGA